MRHIILGTAGHVDHGKTSLVKAITGIDTDRLKEEKERGITIELGFAHLDLKNGRRIGIVDVPGHEKFVKNMVAGAGGIDIVALVIAADEGIMPQTKEHLDICTLLGIRHGLVALTKTDLVEAQWLSLVTEDIKEFLKGSFLESSPIIPLSSETGEGIPEFLSALEELASGMEETSTSGIFRLPVDRVFTMRGFGTVVTGTLISGKLRTGEMIEILPGKITARVRGIQVHNQAVEFAEKGQRTAVNLQGVDRQSIARGALIAHPGIFEPTSRIDTLLRYLPCASGKLKNRTLVRFHTGTVETISRLILLDRDEIEPGESAYAQIVFETPGVNMAGDRFVVRSYSPIRTIGGGQILDPLPKKHKRHSGVTDAEFEPLRKGTDAEKAAVILERSGTSGIPMRGLSVRTGISPDTLDILIKELILKREAILLDTDEMRVVSPSIYKKIRERIFSEIKSYQDRAPLKPGIAKEELKSAQGYLDSRLFNLVIRELEKDGRILVEKDILRTPDHRMDLKGDLGELRKKISEIYLSSKLTPPTIREVVERFGKNAPVGSVMGVMQKEGVLVKINEELYFHRDELERLQQDYRGLLLRKGKSTPADFKELTGLSRKYIIPLLEYFDLIKFTMRVGDHRLLRDREGK
ncbi:MAG: selenocysteine-specific translation elongation factor [Syntrophales bacterium]